MAYHSILPISCDILQSEAQNHFQLFKFIFFLGIRCYKDYLHRCRRMSDAPSSPMEMIDDRKIVGIMQSGVSFKSKEDQKKKKNRCEGESLQLFTIH